MSVNRLTPKQFITRIKDRQWARKVRERAKIRMEIELERKRRHALYYVSKYNERNTD